MDLGWKKKLQIDILQGKESSIESIKEFMGGIEEAFQDAKLSKELEKDRKSSLSVKKPQPHRYMDGELVFLDKAIFKESITKEQGSEKIGAKRFVTLNVTVMIGKMLFVCCFQRIIASTQLCIPIIHVHTAYNLNRLPMKRNQGQTPYYSRMSN